MDQSLSLSSYIDAPGALYATMLLMGDRMKNTGSKGTNNPDHLWGAGRLRMRLLTSAGMDAPTFIYMGGTCVDDGELYDYVWNHGDPLPATVDTIKAAAWWFDYRHDSGADVGTVANVNLVLRSNNMDLSGTNDSDIYDNKAWTYHGNAPDSYPIVTRLSGVNVNGHFDPVCGADSIFVFYAMFAEDAAHTGEYDPLTGEGIFPESL
ncbi:MAG TPA: hypothetical protein VFG69_20500 [Nannocystaceae bacterium]|nr:hypothetical protein [Nannocystaceae bacterium]